jgi:hypothetical protein
MFAGHSADAPSSVVTVCSATVCVGA